MVKMSDSETQLHCLFWPPEPETCVEQDGQHCNFADALKTLGKIEKDCEYYQAKKEVARD